MARLIVELCIALMVVVLSADLLYLYYIESWYDPTKWIETLEVVLLYLWIVLGIGYMVWRVKND